MSKQIDVSLTAKELEAVMAGIGCMVYLGFEPNREAIIKVGNANTLVNVAGHKQVALELETPELGFVFAAVQCLHSGQEIGQVNDSPHTLEELAGLAARLSGYFLKAVEAL